MAPKDKMPLPYAILVVYNCAYQCYNCKKMMLGLMDDMQAIVRVSSKRQITIPAHIFRALGLKPGARLAVKVEDGKMIISDSAGSYTELLAGSLRNVYGRTKEEADEYLRGERESWE